MSLTIQPGLIVPNPYNPREDWTIIKVEDNDVTIRWADDSETLGTATGILAQALRLADVFAPGVAALRQTN